MKEDEGAERKEDDPVPGARIFAPTVAVDW
jgi:hypothetical protein